MSALLAAVLAGAVVGATPLLFGALGELVVERSGVLNLGVEGMMLIGAAVAFSAAAAGLPLTVAVVAAAAAGAAAAGLFAAVALGLLANQYAAGLALAILGSGASAMIGEGLGGTPVEGLSELSLPILSELPVIGEGLLSHDALVYLAFGLVPATAWWLSATRAGLVLRMIGESPETAHALGYPVRRVRTFAVLWGGALAGLGGAHLSLAYTTIWAENMTAGRGWIAIALVAFAAWRPGRALAGALLFGGLTVLQLHGQVRGLDLPSELLAAVPYLATIAALVLISVRARTNSDIPRSLARPFEPAR